MLHKETILIVDDTNENLFLLTEILKSNYNVKVAKSGEKALKIANGERPDLILLDVIMPDMDGYEVCRRLKENSYTVDIPIIFLTAKSQINEEQIGLDLGAVDYITKPISISILNARIRNHLTLKLASDFLKNKNEILEQEVKKRTDEIKKVQDVTIFALAALVEARDNDTGHHIKRTQQYIALLANNLMQNNKFKYILTEGYIDMLYRSAPLHDIGKIGIPDAILLKPKELNEEEFNIIKTHTLIGMKAIENAESCLGAKVEFLSCAKEIILYHHEKWDGSGYPNGIKGIEIPLSARLMAVADVYDALTSERIYRSSMSHERATDIIISGREKHFDPNIVDAFVEVEDSFRKVAKLFNDKTTNRN